MGPFLSEALVIFSRHWSATVTIQKVKILIYDEAIITMNDRNIFIAPFSINLVFSWEMI